MRYFQCSKCKTLLEIDDSKFETKTITQSDGGEKSITNIKPENLSEIICDGRRMRELPQDQFDHETAQRDYVENGGSVPTGTALMGKLNA